MLIGPSVGPDATIASFTIHSTHQLIAEGICYIIVGYVPLVYTEELLAYMYLDDELASIIILVTRPFFFNYTSRMSVHCYRNFFINKHIRHDND